MLKHIVFCVPLNCEQDALCLSLVVTWSKSHLDQLSTREGLDQVSNMSCPEVALDLTGSFDPFRLSEKQEQFSFDVNMLEAYCQLPTGIIQMRRGWLGVGVGMVGVVAEVG